MCLAAKRILMRALRRQAKRSLAKDSAKPRSLVSEPGVFLLWMGALAVSGVVSDLSARSAPFHGAEERAGEHSTICGSGYQRLRRSAVGPAHCQARQPSQGQAFGFD